ncbi:MAG TPA: cation:proton antiporter [Bradyrhizobium sp.]|nr:cation:proton antiporter [Bradyrhizobium sp.]
MPSTRPGMTNLKIIGRRLQTWKPRPRSRLQNIPCCPAVSFWPSARSPPWSPGRRHGGDRHLRRAGDSDGTGDFSPVSSLLDLVKQSVVGIAAGAVLGYLAALLIAHERWAFVAEYAPVVTLVAVIGACFAADGMQASGFMAVFVFGIMLGNKEPFGFKMEAGEAQKLDEYIVTTAFIMRLFIFILLGAQVDFALMAQYGFGGVIVVAILMLVARPLTVFLCALPDRRALES